MDIKIKLINDGVKLPVYQTEHSAGMDLCASLKEPIVLKPLDRKLVGCGFSISIPKGYEAQIRARSGLALKNGITMANGVGTIDADYRGEIGVILINLGNENFIINAGDRIAQMVIIKYEQANWSIINELDETARGTGGFGHTGK